MSNRTIADLVGTNKTTFKIGSSYTAPTLDSHAAPKKYVDGRKALNGFENRTDSSISMSGSSFQITGTYSIFINGLQYSKTGTSQVTISNDQKLHFVYFDTNGTIQASIIPWIISSDNVPIALVFKDGSNYAISDERHGAKRCRDWHQWAHDTIGARYESGLTGTFTDTTLSVIQGVIHDEDIELDTLATKTVCSLWYRNSSVNSMRFESNISKPYKCVAGSPDGFILQYDSAGTLTNLNHNEFVCTYIYATNDKDYPIYTVVGQNKHNTIATARSEAFPSILLNTAEWKLLYKIIYKQVTRTPTYQEASDYRTVSSGPATIATATDHQSLINRDATGAHPFSAIAIDSQTTKTFLAAPNATDGVPSFRTIAASDVPTLNQNTSGTAANLSGTPDLPNGTTATTQTAGDTSTKLATTAFVATALGSVSGDSVKFTVTISHSFTNSDVGKPVAKIGSSYALAKADSAANVEVVGWLVSQTTGSFVLQQSGKFTATAHGLTGPAVWLSADTAGALTETAPTTAGQFLKPVAKVIDANTLEIIDYPATQISAAGTYSTTFTSADSRISAGVLTVTHGLNQRPLFVTMMDGSGSPVDVYPGVTYSSTNAFTVDLSNFTITGTWTLIASKGAGAAVAGGSTYAIFNDTKSGNTHGGTFTAGAWQTRTLNTTQFNNIVGSSLGSNQITLPAGTYKISAQAPAYYVDNHAAKIYNVTSAADAIMGTSAMTMRNSGGDVTISHIAGIVTLSVASVLEVRHKCSSTQSDTGLGVGCYTGSDSVYTTITIEKIG